MTPKIIHFVWLGGGPKSDVILSCIESWKRNCPGWEIREWGDESVAEIGNRYVREALAHKKWAFVADWLRLYVLNKFGGFYLDTDMEIMKPIDRFLENNLTMGLVNRHGKVLFNGGFIGCRPGEPVIAGLLKLYDGLSFVRSDGELDQTPNTVRMVEYFAQEWNVRPMSWTETLDLGEGRVVYPADYFLSREGYSFHHYAASWIDAWLRKAWLRCGRYKLVRFKRRKDAASDSVPKYYPGERCLFSFPIGSRKRLSLVRSKL